MAADYYTSHINLAQDYITNHIRGEIKLEDIARAAGFSQFHFHRIFKDIVGETVNNFVVRQRLERALSLMKSGRGKTLTEIAMESGFRSSTDFSRTFRQYFGIAPKNWDRKQQLEESKIRQVDTGLQHYTLAHLEIMAKESRFEVQVDDFSETQIAYIRVRNSYSDFAGIMNAFESLAKWAEQQGIYGTLIGMSQDDPDITPAAQCRYDVCLTVPAGLKIDRKAHPRINIRQLPACHVGKLPVRGDIYQVDKAWQFLMRYWLPRSGFYPENLPTMEVYKQSPRVIGWEIFDLQCMVPLIS